MARKPNLAGVLENLPAEPAPPPVMPRARRRLANDEARPPAEPTALVGANLHPSYARNLAFLHAETGRSKKVLLQEALDLLFVAKGVKLRQ